MSRTTAEEIKLRNETFITLQNILLKTGPNSIGQLYSRFRNTPNINLTILEMFGFNSSELMKTLVLFPQYFTIKGKVITLGKLFKNDKMAVSGVSTDQSEVDYKEDVITELRKVILESPNGMLKLEELYSIYMQMRDKNMPVLGSNLDSFHTSLKSFHTDFHISKKKNVSVLCAHSSYSDVSHTEVEYFVQEQQNLQDEDKQPSSSDRQVVLQNNVCDHQVGLQNNDSRQQMVLSEIVNDHPVAVLENVNDQQVVLPENSDDHQYDLTDNVNDHLEVLTEDASDHQVACPKNTNDHRVVLQVNGSDHHFQIVDSSTSNIVATFLMMNKREYEQPIIALHVEGFRKKTKFVITVLCIASWDGDVCVIEFSPKGSNGHLHMKEKENLKCLLEDRSILKVCHDCQMISKALQDQFQIQLAYIFDTQICCQILTEKKVARPRPLSFKEVCQYLNVTLAEVPKVDRLWRGHPLTAEALGYLKATVTAIVPYIYRNMLKLLRTTENINSVSQACRAALEDKHTTTNGSNDKENKKLRNTALEVVTNEYANVRPASTVHDSGGDTADSAKNVQPELSSSKQAKSRSQISQPLPLSKRTKLSLVAPSVKYSRLQFDENGKEYFIPMDSEVVQTVNPTKITQEMLDSVKEKNDRDIQLFLDVFPVEIQDTLRSLHQEDQLFSFDFLVEVVLDIGRRPHARYYQQGTGDCIAKYLQDTPISAQQVEEIFSGNNFTEFTSDRRAGIERTLHRVSNISNRQLKPIGLTARVGRAVYGCLDMIFDIVASRKSVLIVGSPGVGKTTVLREFARVLSDVLERRVMIVDTSNEIGGDGDSLHESLGSARRLQVHPRNEQYKFMIEAVQNHNPQVIIIDEMGTLQEAQAAQTIAERGVQLIATAHGQSCEDIHRNPSLRPIAGSAHSVILSKEEVVSRKSETKTMLERQRDPSFDVLIELRERDRWLIHHNLSDSIDAHLRGGSPNVEVRERVKKTITGGTTIQEIRVSVCASSAM